MKNEAKLIQDAAYLLAMGQFNPHSYVKTREEAAALAEKNGRSK
jgi:hypothetical protein